ncbi:MULTISPECIES: YoaK family protein [Chryseobacterium]|uniref:YoaK family protein n=1 Tax=Chryseobacterium endophyticum TaxID=1854762 RepID=A0AAU6WMB5_9FLAO|nr:YoaK family protein [uncultured Chryseobacterium sp.]
MFRHKGKGRTYRHNLKLASLLSCVAGMVNIIGVFSVHTLTTNVTGHFAYFSEQFFLENYASAFTFLLYILAFLLGAFVTGLVMELASGRQSHTSYIIPVSIEIVILFAVGLSSLYSDGLNPVSSKIISVSLLFAMGLQNALVTRVSMSVVRTTHLTGLFTDLGIELSQLLTHGKPQKAMLLRSIFLKLMIISGFFLGGITGGWLYRYFSLQTLMLPVLILSFALWYDKVLFRYYHLKRKYRVKNGE